MIEKYKEILADGHEDDVTPLNETKREWLAALIENMGPLYASEFQFV